MTKKLQAAPTLERKTYELVVTKAEGDDGGRSIAGYANVYGITDTVGDIVEAGAFRRSIANDDIRPLLWQHDSYALIGDGKFVEDEVGLKLEDGRLYEGVQQADEAYAIAKQARFKLGLSVGFSIAKGGAYVDDDGVRHITEAKLYETSVVTWPANEASRIEAVKAAGGEEKSLAEVLLDAADDEALAALDGDEKDALHDAALALADVLEPEPDPEPEADVTALLASARSASALAALA